MCRNQTQNNWKFHIPPHPGRGLVSSCRSEQARAAACTTFKTQATSARPASLLHPSTPLHLCSPAWCGLPLALPVPTSHHSKLSSDVPPSCCFPSLPPPQGRWRCSFSGPPCHPTPHYTGLSSCIYPFFCSVVWSYRMGTLVCFISV